MSRVVRPVESSVQVRHATQRASQARRTARKSGTPRSVQVRHAADSGAKRRHRAIQSCHTWRMGHECARARATHYAYDANTCA